MTKNEEIEKNEEESLAEETLTDMLETIRFLQNYLNDQVVHDVSKILASIFKLINAISGTDLVDIIEKGLQDPNLDKALINPPEISLFGLLRALRDENTKRGMGIMIELLKAIGRASKS